MKFWPKMCGAILLVIVSSSSGLAQSAGSSAAYPEVDRREEQDAAAVLKVQIDRSAVEKARAEKASSPLYRDSGARSSSNWLSKALESIAEALRGRGQTDVPNLPNTNLGGLGQGLIYLIWGLLGAAIVAFLYFSLRHFSWRAKLKRRARAVLDDDEPDRTLDEWLKEADELERQGKYREAVRALYLASLMRFDEARIARFVRGETNWEHYRRIERNAQRLDGLDFREPTREFDRVWYGMDVRGASDVAMFRSWYQAITRVTMKEAA